MRAKIALFILNYLRFFARLQLKKNRSGKIIGITGSAGKTATQNAVYAALGGKDSKYKLKINHKANSESGISLDILGIKPKNYSIFDWLRLMFLAPIQLIKNWEKFDFYIVEMGIDSPLPPKNMDYLLSIIQPQIGILLNALAIHSETFDPLLSEKDPKKRQVAIKKLIAKEKAKLINSLPKNGLAIINADDDLIWQASKKTNAQLCSFGEKTNNYLQLKDLYTDLDVSRFTFEFGQEYYRQAKGRQKLSPLTIDIKGQVLSRAYASSIASAIILASKIGLEPKQIKKNLEKCFTLEPGRSSLLAGKNNSWLLDSSYNASGMDKMIHLAEHLRKTDKRVNCSIALLGDMRELGEEAKLAHEQVALQAAQVFEKVYLVGPLMREYALPILCQELKKSSSILSEVNFFESSQKAGETLSKDLQRGDLVLIKGSQNTIFLEEGLKKLLKDTKNAPTKLCRQSALVVK